jgi:hypothetical protein
MLVGAIVGEKNAEGMVFFIVDAVFHGAPPFLRLSFGE